MLCFFFLLFRARGEDVLCTVFGLSFGWCNELFMLLNYCFLLLWYFSCVLKMIAHPIIL